MKSIASLLTVAALAVNQVAGHYIFQSFAAGSSRGTAWKYVRRNTNPDWLQNGPVTDLASKDLRCNLGAAVGNGTETITMKAGDTFTWGLDTAVYHVGPVSVYMSKAPASANEYDGSGPWFKTADWGAGGRWNLAISYTSSIPKCIASGQYLIRIQSIAIHNPGAAPQFYMSCAQVNVTDGGSGTPSPTALIPGAFNRNDPGLNVNVYGGNLANYAIPGPAVFSC